MPSTLGMRGPLVPYRKKRKNKAADLIVAYRFLRMLVADIKDTDAFMLGIVDDTGKRIKRPRTREEKDAYGPLDRMIFKLKRLLSRAPGGKAKLASYAAALWLIKEWRDDDELEVSDAVIMEGIEREMRWLREEGIANAVGTGNVQGTGVGPKGEPGVYRRRRRKSPVLGSVTSRFSHKYVGY